MINKSVAQYLLATLLSAGLCLAVQARDWRFSSGGTVSGEFSRLEGTMVTILRQGTRFNYPLSAFSKEDQDYVAKCVANGGRAPDMIDTTGLIAPQDVVSRFTFDSQETEHSASFYNVEWKEGAVELNGIYGTQNQGGYRAVFSCPRLDYSQFTVAALIKPDSAGDPLLVGGTGYRWLKIVWEAGGRLALELNNSRFTSRFDGARIQEARWCTLVVTFDLNKHEVCLFLDGSKAGEVKLPKDFKLEVVGTDAEAREKEWTTTDYANGRAFKGSLDELVVYKRALNPKEVSSLKLGGNKPVPTQTAKPPNPSTTPRTIVSKPTAAQPGMLRFELQGYEVPQDTAASIFIAQPDDFDPKVMLSATYALVGARKATMVKLPFIEAFSGARAVATPVGDYTLEADLTLGADKRTVRAIYILRRASDQSGSATRANTRIGDVAFLGTLPGATAGNVVLVFCRLSLL